MNQNIPSYGHNINSLSQNHHMVTQHHNTNPQPFNNITNVRNEKQHYYRDVDTHTIDLTNILTQQDRVVTIKFIWFAHCKPQAK